MNSRPRYVCRTTLGLVGAFEGVAETYEESRRGYPVELRTHLVDSGALTQQCVVVDLGAGTGQLVRLLAPVAAQVVAVEPEADMLGVGRQVTAGLRTCAGYRAETPIFGGTSQRVNLIS